MRQEKSEEELVLEKIKDYTEAISWTKAFISHPYHCCYEDSRKAIKNYQKELTKWQRKLSKLRDSKEDS